MASRKFKARQANDSGRNHPAPLTHFISLPIGHHISLQKVISSFTHGLLETTPALPGFDQTIVIAPRRLHLTLGVMSLDGSENRNTTFDSQTTASNSRKTLADALSLLTSLRSRISELLCGAGLEVPLQIMNIMPPEGGDPDKAHVLWLGPPHGGEDAQRLRAVGEMVNKAFIEAGFIKERRPLKLHCTILNTTYRQPRARGLRQPFSYRSLLQSPAVEAVLLGPGTKPDVRRPVKVNFGAWRVDEIQICKMGSYGPEGEYESCGGLVLGGPQPTS